MTEFVERAERVDRPRLPDPLTVDGLRNPMRALLGFQAPAIRALWLANIKIRYVDNTDPVATIARAAHDPREPP